MTQGKSYDDPVLGTVTLRKGRVRGISIRVHPLRGITVTMPCLIPYSEGLRFLESRREWVQATREKQQSRLEAADEKGRILRVKDPETAARLRTKARGILPERVRLYADWYGFTYGRVFLKANRSNWGSCSARGNINLNIALAAVPEALQDYVILHELCHLKHRNHGTQFHALLDRLCLSSLGAPAREWERQLKGWILA